MIHETAKIQRIAAGWHLVLAIGALGALIYHMVATAEHLQEAKRASG